MKKYSAVLFLLILFTSIKYLSAQTPAIECWITKSDRSALFQKQTGQIAFTNINNERSYATPIIIDDRQEYQSIDGFGFALTGGSAQHLMNMDDNARSSLLHELFDTAGNSIGISYLRLSIGASDLNSFVFSYDDLSVGETDFTLAKFSLAQDTNDVIPVLKEILAINPKIKILGSPWSAPAWMKTNNDVRGDSLKKECYGVYADYLVKYITAMREKGITIDAITIQNEPLNCRNTPSMQWQEDEQDAFIKNNLGPLLKKSGITTKLILFDHNCDRIDYPLALLNDPDVAKYADGTGFHNYGGDISAMSDVHTARPEKNLYFTEQMTTEKPGSKNINILSPVKRLIIGAPHNWSKNVILWNLAANSANDPHTDNGGCSMCQGAVTIDGNNVSRNVAYYTVAHASKFVRPGSVRIASTYPGDKTLLYTEDEERPGVNRSTLLENTQVFPNIAFKTPDGKIVLIVANDSFNMHSFKIQYKGMFANLNLEPGAVGTYVFNEW